LYWLAEGGAGPSWRSAGAWIPAGPTPRARTSALTITHTVIGPVAELGPLYEPRTVTFVDSLPFDLPWQVGDQIYGATVDLPAVACWQELTAANPDALVILSVRESPEQWWESVSETLFTPATVPAVPGTPMAELAAMVADLWWTRLAPKTCSTPRR
jgi:Sulfotransferase domain